MKRGWALWKDVILTGAGLFGLANEAGFHHESTQMNLLIVYVAMLGIGAPDLVKSVKLLRSPKTDRGETCALAPTCPFWKQTEAGGKCCATPDECPYKRPREGGEE